MGWSSFIMLFIVLLGPVVAIVVSLLGYFERVFRIQEDK
jgi:hypothetical protein